MQQIQLQYKTEIVVFACLSKQYIHTHDYTTTNCSLYQQNHGISRFLAETCMLLRHTHTHPFNGPFSGTTQVTRYQKGKTNLDFTEARESEWQWHQLGHMQVSTSLQTTTPAPHRSVFYRPDALPAAQPTASKH